MRNFVLYLSGFLVLLALQEFVIGSINLSQWIAIYIYIMVIILFPLQLRPAPTILLSALLGGAVDVVSGTSALCAICTVWIAFVRPVVIKATLSSDVVTSGGIPFSARIGRGQFLRYTFAMTLLYISLYSFLEVMTLSDIFFTILRVLLSTAATTLLIYILQLPLNKR